MVEGYGIIDVWMQHPTPKHVNQPIFDSLRRWTGQEKLTGNIPVEFTIALFLCDNARRVFGLK